MKPLGRTNGRGWKFNSTRDTAGPHDINKKDLILQWWWLHCIYKGQWGSNKTNTKVGTSINDRIEIDRLPLWLFPSPPLWLPHHPEHETRFSTWEISHTTLSYLGLLSRDITTFRFKSMQANIVVKIELILNWRVRFFVHVMSTKSVCLFPSITSVNNRDQLPTLKWISEKGMWFAGTGCGGRRVANSSRCLRPWL